jgi:glutamate 5-kinase
VGRGLVGFDSEDLPGLLGKSTPDLPPDLRREAVHRDDLILL